MPLSQTNGVRYIGKYTVLGNRSDIVIDKRNPYSDIFCYGCVQKGSCPFRCTVNSLPLRPVEKTRGHILVYTYIRRVKYTLIIHILRIMRILLCKSFKRTNQDTG